MSTLVQDLRFGIRMLLKSPATTIAAVLTLALGIGSNTTLYSWVRALLLNPLPAVREPARVAVVTLHNADGSESSFSYPDYLYYRERNDVLEGLAVYDIQAVNLGGGDAPERLWGMIVSDNYFQVMGIRLERGRAFLPEEGRPETARPVAVVSHALWTRRLGADPAAIGREIRINNTPFTVVGIAPPEFFGSYPGLKLDVWLPMMMQTSLVPGGDRLRMSGNHWLDSTARLKPGVTRERAEASLNGLAASLEKERGGIPENHSRFRLRPIWEAGAGKLLGPLLAALFGIVGIVLLIACVNVADLMLARAAARRHEAAIRLAMGATRRRLIRQTLTESVLLSLLGGAGGWILAQWCSGVLNAFAPPSEYPIGLGVRLDGSVLLFTLVVSVATGLLFGLAPALQASAMDPAPALKDSETGGKRRRGTGRFRGALVVGQVSLSLVLMVCAALFLRSLGRARALNPGFEPKGVLLVSLDLFPNGYDDEKGRRFYTELLDRITTLPGVERASLARKIPLSLQGTSSNSLTIEGYQPAANEYPWAFYNMVGPEYFHTLRVPMLQGRDFNRTDGAEAATVGIVNEAFVKRYWPGKEAVGRRVQFGDTWLTVVGVARDTRYHELSEPPSPYLFLPVLQFYRHDVALHVRVAGDPLAVAAAVQRQIHALDPELPVFGIRTLEATIGAVRMPQQLGGVLLGAFGALVVLLATVGLYGMLAFSVNRRGREMGIRVAVGARPADIRRLIVGQGMRLTALGLGIGILAAVGVSRLLAGFLFEVKPLDPYAFLSVPLLLAAVALLACWLPARRAARVDPMTALRNE